MLGNRTNQVWRYSHFTVQAYLIITLLAAYAKVAILNLLDTSTFVSKGLFFFHVVRALVFTPISSRRALIAHVGI